MGSMADYLENKVLEHTLGKTAYTMPTIYLALYTAAPTDAGGGTEVTGGAYARQAVPAASWASASAGSITTSAAINYPTATAAWGTITAVGIFDALTAGNLLWWGTLNTSKTINSGDTFSITAGNLTVTLD